MPDISLGKQGEVAMSCVAPEQGVYPAAPSSKVPRIVCGLSPGDVADRLPAFPVSEPFQNSVWQEAQDGTNTNVRLPHESAGCQHWYKLILNNLGRNHAEAVVITYRTWPEPCLDPKPEWLEEAEDSGEYADYVSSENRARVARRAKRAIRFACKIAEFDRMITLTTKDNFTREEMELKASKFIRLLRQSSGEVVQYVIVPEIHDSEKTSASKRGSHHLHIAVSGRQNYKLLVKIWHYRICEGRGYVFVTNPFNKHSGKVYSPAQMANYLSKYVSKNLSGGGFGKKSYWISQNIAPPVRTVLLFRTYAEAFSAAIEHFQALGLSFGTEKHRYWRDEAMNVLWLAAG